MWWLWLPWIALAAVVGALGLLLRVAHKRRPRS